MFPYPARWPLIGRYHLGGSRGTFDCDWWVQYKLWMGNWKVQYGLCDLRTMFGVAVMLIEY